MSYCVEPSAATVYMYPALIVNPFGIVAEKDVVTPLLIAQVVGVFRTLDMRLPVTAEFRLFTLPAPGTVD